MVDPSFAPIKIDPASESPVDPSFWPVRTWTNSRYAGQNVDGMRKTHQAASFAKNANISGSLHALASVATPNPKHGKVAIEVF
jgi:hypothetical protein